MSSLDPAIILASRGQTNVEKPRHRNRHLDPTFQFITRKDNVEKFSEQPDFLKDVPGVWFDKIKNIIVLPKKHCGTVTGIVVERYKYIALVFIQNSIGELGVIYRRLVGKAYHKLAVGTRVSVHRCCIRNRVPRLIECAIHSIAAVDMPGFTETDMYGFYTVKDEFQLYEVRMDSNKTVVSTTAYGRVFVQPNTELYKFLQSRLWSTSSVIACRIRYACRTYETMACFFEFYGDFELLKQPVPEKPKLNANREPLLTDFLP